MQLHRQARETIQLSGNARKTNRRVPGHPRTSLIQLPFMARTRRGWPPLERTLALFSGRASQSHRFSLEVEALSQASGSRDGNIDRRYSQTAFAVRVPRVGSGDAV